MPATPIYGLEYEAPAELPGRTLTGEDASPILAEAVEDELERIDAAIQVAADAAAEAALGWTPIGSGTHTGDAFSIDVTAGGKWPAGTFGLMRLHMRGQLADTAWPTLGLNGIGDAGSHRRGYILRRASDGAVEEADFDDTTVWRIGNWASAITGSTLTCTLYGTDGLNLVSFDSFSSRQSGASATHIEGRFWGRHNSTVLVSSLRVGTTSPVTTYDALQWWLEGYRD
jgi:hypothetical protein